MLYFLEEDIGLFGERGKGASARYRDQPSMKQVTTEMNVKLADMEEPIKKSGQQPAARTKAEDWADDRKMWLSQWMCDAERSGGAPSAVESN